MIPATVKIGGIVYPVRVVETPICVDHKECTAAIHYETQYIEVAKNLGEERQEEALWHEVMHGIVRDRFHGLDLGDDEEDVVEAFARGVHAFCVDNGLRFEGGVG